MHRNDNPTLVLSMNQLSKKQALELERISSTWGNPAREFDRKVTHLAQLLSCSEEDATHIILHEL